MDNKKLTKYIKKSKVNIGPDVEQIIITYCDQLATSKKFAKCLEQIRTDVTRLKVWICYFDEVLIARFYTSKKKIQAILNIIFNKEIPFQNFKVRINVAAEYIFVEDLDSIRFEFANYQSYRIKTKNPMQIFKEFGLKSHTLKFFSYYYEGIEMNHEDNDSESSTSNLLAEIDNLYIGNRSA